MGGMSADAVRPVPRRSYSPLTRPTRVAFPLSEARRDLREVLEPRRAFRQVALEPAQRGLLVLRRSALGVEMDELERILEREVRKVAGGVFSSPQRSALDRSAEADAGVRLGGHERMFAWLTRGFERFLSVPPLTSG